MLPDQLEALQEKELIDFWSLRAGCLAQLQNDHMIILRDCLNLGDEGYNALLKVLARQKEKLEDEFVERYGQLQRIHEMEWRLVKDIQARWDAFVKGKPFKP